MRKSLLVLLTSAALLGGVPTLVYAETPAATAPDATMQRKIDLVDRYFVAIHYEQLMDNMMKAIIPPLMENLRKQRPGLTPEQSRLMSDAAIEVSAEFAPQFRDLTVKLYAEAFTEEELTQLVSFYESPVGQSILVKTNAMLPKVSELMVGLLPDLQSKMADRMCAKINCGAEKPASAPKA